MRRTNGIQALECHVLVAKSAVEANQIVNCIRSACSKYKFEMNQQSDLFQYQPYVLEKNYENHVDLITDLNTTSNSISLNGGRKEKIQKSKQEANLGIKNNQSLLSKLKANLNHSHSQSKHKDEKPPLPNRKSANVKITNPNLNDEQKIKDNMHLSTSSLNECDKKHSSIQTITNNKKQKEKLSASSAVSFNENNKLNSTSSASLNKQPEKKLSLGKRILLSARSSIKSNSRGHSSDHSTTNINNNTNNSLNNLNKLNGPVITITKKFENQKCNKNVSDIDFRNSSSRQSIIDENLLNGKTVYPLVHHRSNSSLNTMSNNDIIKTKGSHTPTFISPAKCQNFILKSRSSATPILIHKVNHHSNAPSNTALSSIEQYRKQTINYQSTPSLLIDNHDKFLRTSSVVSNKSEQKKIQNRAVSVTAVPILRHSRPVTPVNETISIHSQRRNCASSASQADFSQHYETKKNKTPIEDTKLLSTHLVWNKNSKSAESIDTKRQLEKVCAQAVNDAVLARAISPGISSINSSYACNHYSNTKSHDSVSLLSYQNSAKVRESPIMLQKKNTVLTPSHNNYGPFTKSVILIRNDEYFIQPETIKKNEADSAVYTFSCDESKNSKSNSRLDLVRLQIEEEQERCSSNTPSRSYHDRIINNGVKVLPTLSRETVEAAQHRRSRLREIEENLYKDSATGFISTNQATKSSEHYHFNSSLAQETDFSDNDHEVIDLTKQARLIDKKANDFPIEIYVSNQKNNNELKVNNKIINLEPFDATQASSRSEMTRTLSSYDNNENRYVEENNQHYFNQIDENKRINYVYYYGSNDDFIGY